MKKLFILAVIVGVFLYSQGASAEDTSTNSLGFAAGGTYGLGLSYSHSPQRTG